MFELFCRIVRKTLQKYYETRWKKVPGCNPETHWVGRWWNYRHHISCMLQMSVSIIRCVFSLAFSTNSPLPAVFIWSTRNDVTSQLWSGACEAVRYVFLEEVKRSESSVWRRLSKRSGEIEMLFLTFPRVRITVDISRLFCDMLLISCSNALRCPLTAFPDLTSAISPNTSALTLKDTVCRVSKPDRQFESASIQPFPEGCFISPPVRSLARWEEMSPPS